MKYQEHNNQDELRKVTKLKKKHFEKKFKNYLK